MANKANAQEKIVDRIQECINRINEFYFDISKYIDTIIDDHQLIKDGWCIDFVVDFHEIRRFAYPWGESVDEICRYSLDDEYDKKKVEQLERELMARIFLFYGLQWVDKPILIPSYLSELKDYLEETANVVKDVEEDFSKILQLSDEMLKEELNEEQWEILQQARRRYIALKSQSNDEGIILPADLQDKLNNLIIEKFPNLFFVVSRCQRDATQLIKDLFKNKCFRFYNEVWNKKKRGFFTEFGGRKSYKVEHELQLDWFPILHTLKPYKWLPNIRDAHAIYVVYKLNKLEKGKRLIILLSSAPLIQTLFEQDEDKMVSIRKILAKHELTLPVIQISTTYKPDKTFVPFRSIDLLRVYLYFRRKNHEGTINELEAFKDMLDKFERVKESINNMKKFCDTIQSCKECPKEYKMPCEKLYNSTKSMEKEQDHLNTLLLVNRADLMLSPYSSILKGIDVRDQYHRRVLKSINMIADVLTQRNPQTRETILSMIEDVKKGLIDIYHEVLINSDELMKNIRQKFLKISNAPYRIQFKDKKLNETINFLISSEIGQPKRILDAIKFILSYISNVKAAEKDYDRDLLLCLIAFCNEMFENTLNQIDMALKKGYGQEETREFNYLKATLYKEWVASASEGKKGRKKIKEYLDMVISITDNYIDSLRFHLIKSAAICWWYDKYHDEDRTLLDETIQESLKRYNQHKGTKDYKLIRILNNLICEYLLTKYDKFDFLKHLGKEMINIAKEINYQLRPAQLHTLSILNSYLSERCPPKFSLKYLKKAIEFMEQAKEMKAEQSYIFDSGGRKIDSMHREVVGKHAFSLNIDYKKYLKDGLVKSELIKAFVENKHPLSSDAKISTINTKWWKIVDGSKRYFIKDTGIQLNTYAKQIIPDYALNTENH